jgi:hypothetical protein
MIVCYHATFFSSPVTAGSMDIYTKNKESLTRSVIITMAFSIIKG